MFRKIFMLVVVFTLVLSACGPAATPEATQAVVPTTEQTPVPPTKEPTPVPPTAEPTAVPTEAPKGLTCAEPVKVGLRTDASGALAIYGAHILRSFMLGMEYATGAAGSAGEKFDFTQTKKTPSRSTIVKSRFSFVMTQAPRIIQPRSHVS